MLLGIALGERGGATVSIRFGRLANRCASAGTMPRGRTNRITISTPP